ncbi:AP-5 complex subunit sigma-1-like [Bacillus rossius redtenbacheri]|uniref:AP-5 complex subunit sigma-1-like n=1 Tax=Bacillus rossius redtenbacheri TaxID=93214 RepID=UPI002FDCCAF3
MVHAIVVQTLQPGESEVLYYRFYSSSEISAAGVEPGASSRPPKLFDTPAEKQDLARHVSRKVQLQFHMKLAQSLVPAGPHAAVRGGYTERGWKERVELPVVWQGWLGSGLALALLCSAHDNLMQAQNVLETLSAQLEKHLQFVSSPAMALSLVETVALVVNQFLPSGRLLFLNSKLVHTLERQLEADLYAK